MQPPPLPQTEEIIITKERLRLLAWGYYISGGLGTLLAVFTFIVINSDATIRLYDEGQG